MILPISTLNGLDEAYSYKIYDLVEMYLKESNWCDYKSNSEVINIINNYKNDLNRYLKNARVLELIAERVRVGSLIRIALEKSMSGLNVIMSIIGDNGKDHYLKQKIYIDDIDEDLIFDQIRGWLNSYAKQLPYDALIKGLVGNEFTVDMGNLFGIRAGQKIEILKPTKGEKSVKKSGIIEWKSEVLAEGEIFNSSGYQAIGIIKKRKSHKYIKIGHWVKVRSPDSSDIPVQTHFEKNQDKILQKGYGFGKIGEISLAFTSGFGKNSTAVLSEARSIKGTLMGFNLGGEFWITRNYWALFEYEKLSSSYSKETGNISTESQSVGISTLKLKGGYRYLPLNHFYGPRLDAYFGYANTSYRLNYVALEGFTSSSFGGLLLGVKVDIPIYRYWRFNASTDIILTSGYAEDEILYGEADSVYSYQFRIGLDYNYSRVWTGMIHFDINSNEAKFSGLAERTKFKEQKLYLGIKMTI